MPMPDRLRAEPVGGRAGSVAHVAGPDQRALAFDHQVLQEIRSLEVAGHRAQQVGPEPVLAHHEAVVVPGLPVALGLGHLDVVEAVERFRGPLEGIGFRGPLERIGHGSCAVLLRGLLRACPRRERDRREQNHAGAAHPSHVPLGCRISCVQRKSAIFLPVLAWVTTASQTWVVRPPC